MNKLPKADLKLGKVRLP